MSSLPKQRYTPQQYLELERGAEFKSEYVNGYVWPCGEPAPVFSDPAEDASRHDRIARNTLAALREWRHGNDVLAESHEADVTVTGRDRRAVVFQILSPQTECLDRGERFAKLRRVTTLRDYVLVSQEQPLVEHYARQDDKRWVLTVMRGLQAVLRLPSIGCDLTFAAIYSRVKFSAESLMPIIGDDTSAA